MISFAVLMERAGEVQQAGLPFRSVERLPLRFPVGLRGLVNWPAWPYWVLRIQRQPLFVLRQTPYHLFTDAPYHALDAIPSSSFDRQGSPPGGHSLGVTEL